MQRDQRITTEHQIGGSQADARGLDIVLRGTDQHMAPGGTALLRQAGGILRDDALAFQMRRHAEDLADGDDAGTTDAGDYRAPDLAGCQWRQLRQGKRRQAVQCRQLR